ncbi:hypothetical protein DPSP01_009939 [Paraphaeosphaeria sporulosa]
MSQPGRLPLDQQMLRGAGIWQAIIALPICLWLGFEAFDTFLEPWHNAGIYYFLRNSTTAVLAAGIIFCVYVQRKAAISPYQYVLFETAKSVLATALWLWFILDAAFGPWVAHCREYEWRGPCHVGARVSRAALASIVLFVVYYPTLGYSYWAWNRVSEKDEEDDEERVERGEVTDRSPLLG